MPSRDEVIEVLSRLGTQSAVASHFGVSRQRVNQILKQTSAPGVTGRPRGSRNAHHVRDEVVPRPRENGPKRKGRTNLQVRGLYSRAQERLQKALKNENKSKLSRELGYFANSQMIYWLLNGSLPYPILRVAVEFEKRFGIPCREWFEPPRRKGGPIVNK